MSSSPVSSPRQSSPVPDTHVSSTPPPAPETAPLLAMSSSPVSSPRRSSPVPDTHVSCTPPPASETAPLATAASPVVEAIVAEVVAVDAESPTPTLASHSGRLAIVRTDAEAEDTTALPVPLATVPSGPVEALTSGVRTSGTVASLKDVDNEELQRRLEVFRGYACAAGPWFAIGMVPRRTNWEVVYGNHRTTALSYLGRPLTIWLTGILSSLNIYVGRQSDNPCVRMSVELNEQADRIAVVDLERLVHPHHSATPSSTFKAVSTGGTLGRVVLQEFYDATSSYQSKDVMARIEPCSLVPGDLVLVECWFVRRELLGDWQTAFHVNSVSRLVAVPGSPPNLTMPTSVSFPWLI